MRLGCETIIFLFFSKKRKCVEGTGIYNPLLSKEDLEGAADAAGKGF
jgi:hypothetical protein